jgi:hypothetical protein
MQYLIVDSTNNQVYLSTHKDGVANAISDNIPDSFVLGITQSNFTKIVMWKKMLVNKTFTTKTYRVAANYKKFTVIDREDVDPDWIKKQKEIMLQYKLFINLNVWSNQVRASTTTICFDKLIGHFKDDLVVAKKIPGVYGKRIQQYATMLGLSPAEAHDQIVAKSNQLQDLDFTLCAMENKWQAKILQCKTENQALQARQNMQKDFWAQFKDRLGKGLVTESILVKDI